VHLEDGSLADLICMVIIIQYIISVLQLHAYLIHSENSAAGTLNSSFSSVEPERPGDATFASFLFLCGAD